MSDPALHAILSASGAERWLNCPASARLEETIPEQRSDYADEGTLAHELAALKVRKAFVEAIPAKKYNAELKRIQAHPLYQDEMQGYTDAYLEYISSVVYALPSRPYIAVEQKLDFSEYVPEGFGTGDFVMLTPDTLYITDFKYGKGVPVSAVDNPQMRLYALGVHQTYSLLYRFSRVVMTIIQPRINNVSSETLSIEELLEFGNYVKPIAQIAFSGNGACNAGEWCRFCRAKAQCRARAERYIALEVRKDFLPPLISNEEVGEILAQARSLAKWVNDLEEYALSECLKGGIIPGWKAVEGRSVRAFANTDEAFKVLIEAGVEEAMLYERKPASLASIEKLIGKKRFGELLMSHVITPPGKPALVIETDKREAITANGTAAVDFANTSGGQD